MLNKVLGNSEYKKLASNFFSLLLVRGLQFLIPLMTFPYLVRVIGFEKFGLINFALALSVFFGAVVQYGFGITVTKNIARSRGDLREIAGIYSTALIAGLFLVFVCAILFASIVLFFERFDNDVLLYFLVFLFVMFQSLFPEWFFRGVESMQYIALLSLSSSSVFLVCVWVFVRQESDYFLVPLFNCICAGMVYFLSLFLIRFQFGLRFEWPGIERVKLLYCESGPAFVAQFAPNLYNNAAIFFLGLFGSAAVLGIYTAAAKLIDAVMSFGYILSGAFLPYLSRNIKKHIGFQKIMQFSGVILAVCVFFSAETFSEILFGSSYRDIYPYVKMLSIAIIFGFVYLTYNSNYLMIVGYERLAGNIALYVSVVAFFYTIVLIYFFGINGAVCSLLMSRAALSLLSFFFYKKVHAKC